MARSARDLEEDNRSLDSTAQDMREAMRALDYSQAERGAGEILVAISRLEALMEQQAERDRKLEKTLTRISRQMQETLSRAEKLAGTSIEEREKMQDAVASGLMEAHSQATEHAIREITEVTDAAKRQVRALEKQAQARTARLLRVTLPDKLFDFLKWLLVLTGLVISGWFIFCVVLNK